MFSVLPSVVQSRLPPLQSLRRSVSFRGRVKSCQPDYPLNPRIPAETEAQTTALQRLNPDQIQRPVTPEMLEIVTQDRSIVLSTEQQSGLDWKCGQLGLNLMGTSLREANQDAAMRSPSFERKAYIDGVSYLLKALPQDLDESELAVIRRSLPKTMEEQNGQGRLTNGPENPNLLHRSIQRVVVKIFILLHLIMPYVIFFFRQAAQLERKYKVSENVVGQAMDLANAFGRGSVTLSGAIFNMGDGKVGQALASACSWALEGVAGGLSDGVGEGLAAVNAKRP